MFVSWIYGFDFRDLWVYGSISWIYGFDLLEVSILNVLEFFVLRLIMSVGGWVCLDLVKNMEHEVLGKKKKNVLPKKIMKSKKKKKEKD